MPYIWDIIADNASFEVRDTTGAGSLPFFIAAGTPTAALFLQGDSGDIGMGTGLPETALHVVRRDGSAGLIVEEQNATPAARQLLYLRNNGQTYFTLEDTSITAGPNSGRAWNFQNLGGTFRVTTAPGGTGEVEMVLDVDGNMTIEGNYFAASGTELNVPDYVFDDDYDLKPLSEFRPL